MPLILSAINFKLSETGDEMDARRRPLQYLSELMKLSTYDVADEILLRTDDILHLANRISQQIFLQNSSNPSRSNSIQYSRKGSITSLSDSSRALKTGKYRVKNWHQAFLQHTRAYLLISLSVDYFMSVGQLPRNSDLPELVCFMPPFGEIRLPWSISQGFPSPSSAERARRRSREIQRIRTVSEESSVRFIETGETSPRTSTAEMAPQEGTEGHKERNDVIPDTLQNDFAMNVDYFDLGQSLQPFHTDSFENESTSLPLQIGADGMAGHQYWQNGLYNMAGITPFKDGELSHLVDDCLTSKFLNS